MDIRPIRTEADHAAALREISALMETDPVPDSPEGERLDVLVTLTEAFEKRHWPIAHPDPIEAIKFRMEQAGLTARDLQPAIGGLNRVYEVLNHKRGLSLAMIRKLHAQFGVPLESLVSVA